MRLKGAIGSFDYKPKIFVGDWIFAYVYYIFSFFLHKVQDNDYGNGTSSIKKKGEEKRKLIGGKKREIGK